jgi:AcrR family transcriptional regulator
MDPKKSPAQERKEREKEKRIKDIQEQAKRIFCSKGYVNTTIDEIAYQTGFSKPTLYKYFKSKDALHISLVIPGMDFIAARLQVIKERTADGYKSGSTLIKDLFKVWHDVYEMDPAGMKIFSLLQNSGMIWDLEDEALKVLIKKGKDNSETTRSILRQAIKKGLIKKINVYHFVDIVISALFLGLTNTADFKKLSDKNFKNTLKTAEKMIIDAVVANKVSPKRPKTNAEH